MRRLLVYQAMWAMENLPGVDLEGGLESAMDKIAQAGFDGVSVSLMRPDRAEAVASAIQARGQSFEAIGFIRHRADLAHWISRAEELGAHHLNVQIMERPDRVADAAVLMSGFEEEAAKSSVPVYYETHRGRLTNDLLFVCRLLDAMPDLKLTADLSHYPLVHEMPLPVPPSDLARISKVLARTWAFHGRVSGSHQVQVSIAAPQHQGWVAQFKAWWREGFVDWIGRSVEGADLTFTAELGPPNYAIIDADGRELADRWAEALMLKDMAREIWRDAAAQA